MVCKYFKKNLEEMFGIKIFLVLVLQLTKISVGQETFFLDNPRELKMYGTWQESVGGFHMCIMVPGLYYV